MTEKSKKVDIRVIFEDESDIQQMSSSGGFNPYLSVAISVGDMTLSGEDRGYIGGHGGLVYGMVEAVEDIIAGNKEIVTATDGPTYLVFEPNEDWVRITVCDTRESAENPDKRTDIEPSAIAEKEALVSELLSAGNNTVDRAIDINPDLAANPGVQRLKTLINYLNESEKEG